LSLPSQSAFRQASKPSGLWGRRVVGMISLTLKTRAGDFLPTETTALRLDHSDRLYVLVLVTDVSEHRHRNPSRARTSS
jgi:hypothetical protein